MGIEVPWTFTSMKAIDTALLLREQIFCFWIHSLIKRDGHKYLLL